MSHVLVFGSANMDVVARVPRLPLPGETLAAGSLAHVPGGKGANQAVAAARFGAACELTGALGQDDHGRALAAFLDREGIATGRLARVEGPSGLALITIDAAGENQIIVVAGANAKAKAPDLAPVGAGPRPVALAQLELPVDEVERFLLAARRAGRLSLLNAAPALLEATHLVALPDILVVNETELAVFTGDRVPAGIDEAAALAARLPRKGAMATVVTLGADGVVALVGETVLHVPAQAVPVVDTVGAGDCFCGVLAAALAEGQDLEAALRAAVAAAGLAVQQPGAADAMPLRAQVLAQMA